MALAEPQHPEEIEAAQRAEKAKRLAHTHGVVWPDGRVTQHYCPPPDKGLVGQERGDVPAIWINGSVQVTERWRKEGVRLLSDVCREDGVPELYKRWRDAIALAGKVKISNHLELYPPTVLRLRREHASGYQEGVVFDAATGKLVPSTDATKNDRVAGLLDASGVGRPDPSDAKKAGKS